ncbi:FMN-binding negative transcriptional regulator [Entomomonas asaccharolytica]|uniref:FMN-binding negative transcriptional regulator n=1 Tax=Entomomonas asaccharolytica TaxID=2785331 RepID=A0A974NDT9_9GAMM|nr:FMN-binding negative transcriptional regulator [Entomomonas asaccharolytica]QQP84749.1 FMN-binding negative transcriptional regulator [Entomomonas asaccharolytica]
MYIPKHFQDNDQQSLFNTIQQIQTANLVTQHPSGLIATYLPLYLEQAEGAQGTLYGHIAKANTQWQQPLTTTEALAIFTGPDGYITPSWYPTKKIHHKEVPTWNYIAVHTYGTIEFIEEPNTLLDIVTKLTNANEENRQQPWQVSDAPQEYIQAMLKAIIGVKITINKIEGKRKLSQNKTPENQQGVIQGLTNSEKATDKQLAALMQNKP